MTWALLAAALAVAIVIVVALPFLREPAPASDALNELTPVERRLLEGHHYAYCRRLGQLGRQ